MEGLSYFDRDRKESKETILLASSQNDKLSEKNIKSRRNVSTITTDKVIETLKANFKEIFEGMSEIDKIKYNKLIDKFERNPDNPKVFYELLEFLNESSIKDLLKNTPDWQWTNCDKLEKHLKIDPLNIELCKKALISYTESYASMKETSKLIKGDWKNKKGEALVQLRKSYFFNTPQILLEVRDIAKNQNSRWFELSWLIDVTRMKRSGAC